MVFGSVQPFRDLNPSPMTREALAAFDLLSRPVWVVDVSAETVWWANRAAVAMFEMPALEVLLGRDLCPLPPSILARLERGLPPLSPDQDAVRESVVVRQARRSLILDCEISALRIEGGRPGLLVEGTPHDERPVAVPSARRAEEALSATSIMVSMFSLDGHLLYLNAAAHAAYDGAGAEGFADRFVNDAEAAHALVTLSKGRVYRCEGRFKTAQGDRWHALEARMSHADPQNGGEPREATPVIVVTEYDMTEYVMGRISLQETVERLARSNGELEQFAWITSHDLREPLRNVVSYLNLLKRRIGSGLEPEAQEFMSYAIEGALRLDTLTRDLTEYAAIGRGGRVIEPVDMAAVVETVRTELSDEIIGCHAKLTIGTLPVLPGDAVELRMLMGHLLSNALKYVPDDVAPHITIAADREDQAWVFAVVDNGIGIDPRYFNRVFQIFQRLHGRDAYGGTGVGLAICRKIVERHGGRIWIDSTPGKGTAIFFTLPVE